jgi:hypothetical protein
MELRELKTPSLKLKSDELLKNTVDTVEEKTNEVEDRIVKATQIEAQKEKRLRVREKQKQTTKKESRQFQEV